MNKLSRSFHYCAATAMLAIGNPSQSAILATQLDEPHEWYWLGHWHLWHGGWAYWWAIPLFVVLVGVTMFYLGRLSGKNSHKPPSD